MAIRLANLDGRAHLVLGDGLVDVERASGGRLPADPMAALAAWDELRDWGEGLDPSAADVPLDEGVLGPCVPRPQKVFGIALNYRRHAEETGAELPPQPSVFTKFQNAIAAPRADVVIPSATVDWEVELVAVIGRGGRHIGEDQALDHVAGYCAGQDYSDRAVQMAGSRPQFSMGKSFDTFGPIGPWLTSLDAFDDPGDVGLWCEIDGERVQDSRTSDLIFSVPRLVSYLSSVCTLAPGDLVFTGTPEGVGVARRPPRFLRAGETVTSGVEGVGVLVNRVRAAA